MASIEPEQGAPAAAAGAEVEGGLRLPVAAWAALWIVAWVGLAILMHFAVH